MDTNSDFPYFWTFSKKLKIENFVIDHTESVLKKMAIFEKLFHFVYDYFVRSVCEDKSISAEM